MKLFAPFAFFSGSLALSRAVFEPTVEDIYEKDFGNVRSLFDENLPLPKDWMAGAKEDAPSKTFGAFGGNHQRPVHGSFPYHGNPGGLPGHPLKPNKPIHPGKPNHPAADNMRVLSTDQDLPLPTDWMVAASAKDSTYGGEDNEHGSYPYSGGPGGEDGDDHDDGYGDNTYPAYGSDHPDKMYKPKSSVVRSLETVMLKKSKDDQTTPFYLRGRQPSA